MSQFSFFGYFSIFQVRKKEPKPKLFGPDIFGRGGGLPREGAGAKKFGMSLGAQKKKTRLFGGMSKIPALFSQQNALAHRWQCFTNFSAEMARVPLTRAKRTIENRHARVETRVVSGDCEERV